jgi:hypothetical protein
MQIRDLITKEQKQKLNQIKSSPVRKKKKKRKKKEEQVNWHEIMGTNNRGLRRKKGGAWTN